MTWPKDKTQQRWRKHRPSTQRCQTHPLTSWTPSRAIKMEPKDLSKGTTARSKPPCKPSTAITDLMPATKLNSDQKETTGSRTTSFPSSPQLHKSPPSLEVTWLMKPTSKARRRYLWTSKCWGRCRTRARAAQPIRPSRMRWRRKSIVTNLASIITADNSRCSTQAAPWSPPSANQAPQTYQSAVAAGQSKASLIESRIQTRKH